MGFFRRLVNRARSIKFAAFARTSTRRNYNGNQDAPNMRNNAEFTAIFKRNARRFFTLKHLRQYYFVCVSLLLENAADVSSGRLVVGSRISAPEARNCDSYKSSLKAKGSTELGFPLLNFFQNVLPVSEINPIW